MKDMEESLRCYSQLFRLIGRNELTRTSHSRRVHEIYFQGSARAAARQPGRVPICFRATSREMGDAVGAWLKNTGGNIIHRPQPMPQYLGSYYSVDFRDPSGWLMLEVAHTLDIRL